MGEESCGSGKGTCNGGCAGGLLLVLLIVATISMGPVDFCRTVYNQMTGDGAIFKTELVDHVRARIAMDQPLLKTKEVEAALARETGWTAGGAVDPQKIASAVLWAAVEKHARGWKESWLWVKLQRSKPVQP